MTDQCVHCSVRGDLKACRATVCSIHKSWYAQTLAKKLKVAELRVATHEATAGHPLVAMVGGKPATEFVDDFYELERKYNELIMAVESKCPNESRHQTALRYIGQTERAKGFCQTGGKNEP